MASYTKRSLIDWSFTQIGGGQGTKADEWLKVSSFPTTVHVELLKLKKIPDPFLKLQEWDVQWVGESQWEFKTEFKVTEEELKAPNADLVFEGLDTFAIVILNGKEILRTENQFVAHRVSTKEILQVGTNHLSLNFDSAFKKGREIESKHEKLNLWNGDSSRLHVRKAQYNYGWDWGPILMTVGPWKPISLELYTTRIADLDIRNDVSESLAVTVSTQIVANDTGAYNAKLSLKGPAGSLVALSENITLKEGKAGVVHQFAPGDVDLWYPVGYGKQPLYTVEVELSDSNGQVLDKKTERIAFRRAIVVQEPLIDQEGRTFLFEINNIRIFIGGSNWIPADSFLTAIPDERYKAWLNLMVKGNQNMVRVWGGGIYEAEVFYNTCDELGLLVWQDFMFGCGQYPAYDSFVESVTEEAEQNVKRLRHHPSVVILAGNNEDYQVAESLNLELDYSDETSDFRKTNFPARYIYERVLPAAVEKHSDIHYHRSSPYSGFGKDTRDQQHGDLHQWNVWHGTQEPWHNWDKLAGRFVSEFGMEGYPDIRTVDYWLDGDAAERYPQSKTNNNHNKADGFERRLELYLVENFKHSFQMDSYVYYTQVMQAETLAAAYRLWRRNWAGKGREYTAGALVWQINDCWPVTSWAIADYFLRPKPAFFTIARELRPYTVGMTRKEVKSFPDPLSVANFKLEIVFEFWGTNSTLEDKEVTFEVTSFDLHSGSAKQLKSEKVTLKANQSTELAVDRHEGNVDYWATSIVSARLLDENGQVFTRYANWPEPFKFIHFPPVEDLGLKIVVADDAETITVSAQRPIKGIVLDADGEDVQWSDQAIDLVPDDPQTLKAIGLKGRKVKARFLGDGTA